MLIEVVTPMIAVTLPTVMVLFTLNLTFGETLPGEAQGPVAAASRAVGFVVEYLGFAYAAWLMSLMLVAWFCRHELATRRALHHRATLLGSLAIGPVFTLIVAFTFRVPVGGFIALIYPWLAIPAFIAGAVVCHKVGQYLADHPELGRSRGASTFERAESVIAAKPSGM